MSDTPMGLLTSLTVHNGRVRSFGVEAPAGVDGDGGCRVVISCGCGSGGQLGDAGMDGLGSYRVDGTL
jgi:hypothetical protein